MTENEYMKSLIENKWFDRMISNIVSDTIRLSGGDNSISMYSQIYSLCKQQSYAFMRHILDTDITEK